MGEIFTYKTDEGTVNIIVEDLTPNKAEKYLKSNTQNRKLNQRRVDVYKNDMINGRWKQNGIPIIIGDDGILKDGQHRLSACIRSGITLKNQLVIIMPQKQANCYDIGLARSVKDIALLEGFDDINGLIRKYNSSLYYKHTGRRIEEYKDHLYIKGYVEGLIDGVANTPEKQDKYIRTIYNKANDMDRLIDELTLYSRIDSDRVPYNFHRINVGDYFGDCVEEIGMDLESRGIELNYSNLIAPETRIIGDPEQLKRVINNIVGNSVKYLDKPHGRIMFRLLDEEDSIRVEIEDNGKGIAPRDIPYIFDRFYRTDSSRNSAKGGSGIGLSIVKKIIEDHGGYIWATSTLGEGTCMHIVLRKYQEKMEQEYEDLTY